MTNNGIVKIQGKDYMTVAGRLELAHKSGRLITIETEVVQHTPVVVVKACVYLRAEPTQMFMGISAANPAKSIEKMSPYEVAETSAVGRALGFAGFGAVESIATADEMKKAGVQEDADDVPPPTDEDIQGGNDDEKVQEAFKNAEEELHSSHFCALHNKELKSRGRGIWDHRAKGRLEGDKFTFDNAGDWYWCQGGGYHLSANQ